MRREQANFKKDAEKESLAQKWDQRGKQRKPKNPAPKASGVHSGIPLHLLPRDEEERCSNGKYLRARIHVRSCAVSALEAPTAQSSDVAPRFNPDNRLFQCAE